MIRVIQRETIKSINWELRKKCVGKPYYFTIPGFNEDFNYEYAKEYLNKNNTGLKIDYLGYKTYCCEDFIGDYHYVIYNEKTTWFKFFTKYK